MKTKHTDAEIARCAKAVAARYRSLAFELLGAATSLETVEAGGDALPVVSIESFGTAIKGGMILHYLADGQ